GAPRQTASAMTASHNTAVVRLERMSSATRFKRVPGHGLEGHGATHGLEGRATVIKIAKPTLKCSGCGSAGLEQSVHAQVADTCSGDAPAPVVCGICLRILVCGACSDDREPARPPRSRGHAPCGGSGSCSA